MADSVIEKKTFIGSRNVTASGHLEVRLDTYIVENGIVISGPQYHRYVLNPGDDVSNQPAEVQAIAKAAWTPEIIGAWEQLKAAQAEKAKAQETPNKK